MNLPILNVACGTMNCCVSGAVDSECPFACNMLPPLYGLHLHAENLCSLRLRHRLAFSTRHPLLSCDSHWPENLYRTPFCSFPLADSLASNVKIYTARGCADLRVLATLIRSVDRSFVPDQLSSRVEHHACVHDGDHVQMRIRCNLHALMISCVRVETFVNMGHCVQSPSCTECRSVERQLISCWREAGFHVHETI